MGKDVIIACDFADKKTCLDFLDGFKGRKPFVKIGMELFYAEGPEIVREIKVRGHKIFLDLKLHDIPNTVKKSMAVLSRLDVDMCNLHAAGASDMMAARGAYKTRRHTPAADSRHTAHLHERGDDAQRPAHKRQNGGCRHALRPQRRKVGA